MPSRRDCAAWRGIQRTRFGSHDSLRAGLRSWKIAKYWAFSHCPFREQRAEKFCSTPLNRRSATHRRNTRMEQSPRLSPVRQGDEIGGANRSCEAGKNNASLLPLSLVDDAQLRTTRRLSRWCAEPPRLCCLAWHPANSVWQSRVSSCWAAIMGNSEILKYWAFSRFPFREQSAEKSCSTPLNRRSGADSAEYQDG